MFLDQIKKMAYGNCLEEIQHVTPEEIAALSSDDLSILHSIMIGPHVSLAIATLQRIGFFVDLVPEIQDGLDLKSSKSFKEIWPHTIRVVGQAPPHLNVRWAALFHDLGKAQAFEIKNNKVTFYNHEFISSRIFSGFALYTGIFSGGQRRAIRFLISHLGYVENYSAQWTDSAVRRFDKEIGIYLDDLLTLSEADITTGRPENRRKILGRLNNLKDRIAKIRELDSQPRLLPKGIGTEISVQLGIPEGPLLGKTKKDLEDKVKRGELLANENYSYYIEYLIKNKVESTNTQE
jgi:poly(A) polymerase